MADAIASAIVFSAHMIETAEKLHFIKHLLKLPVTSYPNSKLKLFSQTYNLAHTTSNLSDDHCIIAYWTDLLQNIGQPICSCYLACHR